MAYMVFQNEKKWKGTTSLSELLFWDTPLFIYFMEKALLWFEHYF